MAQFSVCKKLVPLRDLDYMTISSFYFQFMRIPPCSLDYRLFGEQMPSIYHIYHGLLLSGLI